MYNTGSFLGGGPDAMFSIVPVLILIGFAIVLIGIVINGVRYFKNTSAPRQSVYARVAAKRMEVRSHAAHHANDSGAMNHQSSSRTYYYITLEFDNGERKEFLDVKSLYGLVVEGDVGHAAVQGDWIVAFERNAAPMQP